MQAQSQAEAASHASAELSKQLHEKAVQQAELRQQLQAASVKLDESQSELAQALSDSLALRSQPAESAVQLEQVRYHMLVSPKAVAVACIYRYCTAWA